MRLPNYVALVFSMLIVGFIMGFGCAAAIWA